MWTFTGKSRPPFADEPAPGQESVWDYPRPPALERSERLVVVGEPGQVIAESSQCMRVCETASPPTYYLPPDSVAPGSLVRASGSSFCEWKGMATYWALAAAPEEGPVGWSYDVPNPAFADIAGWYAFYPGRVPCFVDGERVVPQPGGFYGGWVTSDLAGPFKGDPGTTGW